MCILMKEKEELVKEIEENYLAIYKCRNCGKVYENKNVTFNDWIMPVAPMNHPHFCKSKTYGIGDLVGVRSTNREGGWEKEFYNIELEEQKT